MIHRPVNNTPAGLVVSAILALSFVGSAMAASLDYREPPLDNPLKGLVPYPGSAIADRFPHSMEFHYIALNEVLTGNPSAGQYTFDWTVVETALEEAKARGNQGIIRIFSEYPGSGLSIPQFLVDGGVTVTELPYGNQTAFTPDYENIDLLNALKATVVEFGKDSGVGGYDGDVRVAFIELGLLGVWGEWHNFGQGAFEASSAVRGEVLDAYEANFSSTKLLTRYPRGAADGDRSNFNRSVGYHDDSFTWNTLGTDAWKFMELMLNAGALNKWQTQPIGGELFPELNDCVFEDLCEHEGTAATNFLETVEATHASYMRLEGAFQTGFSAERRERADAAVRRMGYDLHFDQATITPTANGFTIDAVLENRGVAPFYYNWPMTVGLLDAAGATIEEWSVGWRIDGLLPGDDRTFNQTFIPATVVPAGAQIALRVSNPMAGGHPVRFSNFSQQLDGQAWMMLGGADGAPPVGAPPAVLFIRGGAGTVGFFENGSDEQGADAFNYTTAGGNHSWGELNSVLVAEGFQVEQLSENPVIGGVPTPVPFETMNLDLYSVIVFGSNNAEYTVEQIDAITDFIEDGGSALFVSDANFGQNWGDAPSSDQHFLDRFGMTMNQDGGTYGIRRASEFVVPNHPIFTGVDEFDGEGVSPVTRNTPPAGVTSTLLSSARFNVRQNTGPGQGPEAPAAADDGSLVVATFGSGRVAGHFDRNTFFNENGAGTDINRLDNETFTRNLFNWLAGNSIAAGNFAPRGYFPDIPVGTSITEGLGFSADFIAKDPDGSVASVSLAVDGVLISTDTIAPYDFNVPGQAIGNRELIATIIDDLGAMTEVKLGFEVTAAEPAIDRSAWTLSATNNVGDLGNAIDGDLTTRWATQQAQQAGQKFSIDFGQRELFQRIVLENPGDPDDFARGYIVRASDDGANFVEIANGAGTGAKTEILLSAPATYRYLEIEQTGSAAFNWWSIHEINVLRPPTDSVLPLSSWLQFYYGDTPPGLLDDSDGDELTLLEEYAYRANPLIASIAEVPLIQSGVDAVDQRAFIDFTYRRWKDTGVGTVNYLIESSTDLAAWSSAGFTLESPVAPTSNGDGTETVTARLKFNAASDRGFLRLRLNEQ